MTVEASTMPKSALRAAGAPDCRPLLPPYPLAHTGEGRERAGASLALPAISPAQVKSLNAFYRPRPALAFSVAGCAATMTASSPSASADASGKCRLDMTVDGAAGEVIFTRTLIAVVIAAIDPIEGLDGRDPLRVVVLLALAVSNALSRLEASLGARLAIPCVRAADDEGPNAAAALAFNIAVD